MFDIGFTELLILGIIALMVLGPEKLPHAARMAGAWYGRIKRTLSNVQREIEQEVSALEARQRLQAELDLVKTLEANLQQELAQTSASFSTDTAAAVSTEQMQAPVNTILPPTRQSAIKSWSTYQYWTLPPWVMEYLNAPWHPHFWRQRVLWPDAKWQSSGQAAVSAASYVDTPSESAS